MSASVNNSNRRFSLRLEIPFLFSRIMINWFHANVPSNLNQKYFFHFFRTVTSWKCSYFADCLYFLTFPCKILIIWRVGGGWMKKSFRYATCLHEGWWIGKRKNKNTNSREKSKHSNLFSSALISNYLFIHFFFVHHHSDRTKRIYDGCTSPRIIRSILFFYFTVYFAFRFGYLVPLNKNHLRNNLPFVNSLVESVYAFAFLFSFVYVVSSISLCKCPIAPQCVFVAKSEQWTPNTYVFISFDCNAEIGWFRPVRKNINKYQRNIVLLIIIQISMFSLTLSSSTNDERNYVPALTIRFWLGIS